MKRMLCLGSVLLLAAASVAEDPAETLKNFRAPAAECREAVKGFLWLEAEAFSDYGGWEIDTQFVHKMGSAYLITKGVLKPLASATTEIAIPSSGTWRAWVRTKDWLPEFSPGKFALEVGGKRSSALGVSKKVGWCWEKAGDFTLAAGKTSVALVDLAGGFARCDAVLLTTELGYVPPDGGEELESARRRLSGADPTIADGGMYDVVVVGAGPGGLGASIAAARHGMKTLLVHDRPVLGGNNSIEQHTSIGGSGHNRWYGVANSREGGILEEVRLMRRGLRLPSESAVYRLMVDREPLITERPNERVLAAEKKGDRIVSVTASSTLTGGRARYRGKVFIDGTGDGWLGYFVGASRMYGREAKSEFGEKDAPDKADTLTMSGCIDDYVYHGTGKEESFEVPEWAHILPEGFNRPDVNGIQARWWLEHPGTFDDLDDPERARAELIRIHLDYWGWLREHPTFGVKARTSRLDEIKIHNGRREGWRFLGDYVLTSTDCRDGRRFQDAITCGGWALDLHDPMGVMNPKGNGWWSVDATRIYTIPYRCIYSKDIANLYMAGRNISVTHAALGSTRIMGTIFTIGQATGTAAAMAVRENLSVRDVGTKRIKALQQMLLKDDQFIPGVVNDDPHDKARSAKVTASSCDRCDQTETNKKERPESKPEYVIDGLTRPGLYPSDGPCTHAWRSNPENPLPQWVRLDFPHPVTLCEVRIVFDSQPTGGSLPWPMPKTLAKDYSIWGLADGKWRKLTEVKDNIKRLQIHRFESVKVQSVKVQVDATWGGKSVHIQEIRVYEGDEETVRAATVPESHVRLCGIW